MFRPSQTCSYSFPLSPSVTYMSNMQVIWVLRALMCRFLGKYEPVSIHPIGSGGFSSVFHCRDDKGTVWISEISLNKLSSFLLSFLCVWLHAIVQDKPKGSLNLMRQYAKCVCVSTVCGLDTVKTSLLVEYGSRGAIASGKSIIFNVLIR